PAVLDLQRVIQLGGARAGLLDQAPVGQGRVGGQLGDLQTFVGLDADDASGLVVDGGTGVDLDVAVLPGDRPLVLELAGAQLLVLHRLIDVHLLAGGYVGDAGPLHLATGPEQLLLDAQGAGAVYYNRVVAAHTFALSLHDALPICPAVLDLQRVIQLGGAGAG